MNDAGKRYADRISKSAQFMDALLCDLLAFSRISQRRVQLTSMKPGMVVESMLSQMQKDPYDDRGKFPLPAVMLLDLNMPMKNGFDVLAWVRAQPGLKRLSIIVMTASLRAEDLERAFDFGANSFLVKPGTLDALVAMIRCLRDWMQVNHFPSLDAP